MEPSDIIFIFLITPIFATLAFWLTLNNNGKDL